MSIQHCFECDREIDTDFDAEHFDDCGEDQNEGFEFVEIGAEANEHELIYLEDAGRLPSGW